MFGSVDRHHAELDRVLAREREIVKEVLEILHSTSRGKSKSLRQEFIRRVRAAFDFHEKKCSRCGQYLPRREFPTDSCKPDGLRPCCNACEKVYRMKRYWKNPEKFRAAKSEYDRRKRAATAANGKETLNDPEIPQVHL